MKKTIIISLFYPILLIASQTGRVEAIFAEEQALALRRIDEFWKDGDRAITKQQLQEFLVAWPHHEKADELHAFLGDILLQEGAYSQALEHYGAIRKASIAQEVITHSMEANYRLGEYEKVLFAGQMSSKDESLSLEETLRFHFLLGEAYLAKSRGMEAGSDRQKTLDLARSHLEKVSASPLTPSADSSLAEIVALRGESDKASKLYEQLAQKYPEKKESYLLTAGVLKASYDPIGAMETFSAVEALQGQRAWEASFNRLVVMADLGRYEELLTRYSSVMAKIPNNAEKVRNDLVYLAGKSHFELGQKTEALNLLSQYLESSKASHSEIKEALIMQMRLADVMNDRELFTKSLNEFTPIAGSDERLSSFEMSYALLLERVGETQNAAHSFERLLSRYPQFPSAHLARLHLAADYFSLGQYLEAREMALYVSKFGPASLLTQADSTLIAAGSHLVASGDSRYSRELFYYDIKRALGSKSLKGGSDLIQTRLLLAKTAYETARFQEALDISTEVTRSQIREPELGNAHLIAALAHEKLGSLSLLFRKHAEAALTHGQNFWSASDVRLALFRSYFKEGKGVVGVAKEQSLRRESLFESAAGELYQAFTLNPKTIDAKDLLWAADFYYRQLNLSFDPAMQKPRQSLFSAKEKIALERSIAFYQNFCLGETNHLTLKAGVEEPTLKLATLYEVKGEGDRQRELLEELVAFSRLSEDSSFRFQDESRILLAALLEKGLQNERALSLIGDLAASKKESKNIFTEYAKLQKARLYFQISGIKEENHPEAQLALKELKDITLKKEPTGEPLYLEAACDYARIRAELSTESLRNERYHFFLKRVKESYSDLSDPQVARYQELLSQDAQKMQLYESYMLFIDAKIASLEGQHDLAKEKWSELTARVQEGKASYYLEREVVGRSAL